MLYFSDPALFQTSARSITEYLREYYFVCTREQEPGYKLLAQQVKSESQLQLKL